MYTPNQKLSNLSRLQSALKLIPATLLGVLIASYANAKITYQPYSQDLSLHNHYKLDNNEVEFEVMATSNSPTLPIDKFVNDWDAPLDSGDFAYIQGRAGIQFRPIKDNSNTVDAANNTQFNINQGALSYGIGWRYDYLLSFSEETSTVYWQHENKQSPSTNTHYPLFLEASHNERIGANIGYTLPILTNLKHNWTITTKANLWQGQHVLDGVIKGGLNTRNTPLTSDEKIRDSIDTVQADIDYYYDKPALGEEDIGWDTGSPDGYGYSLDVALTGNINEDTKIAIAGYDLLGRMHWQDASSTQYYLDYDVNGRPLYTLEGQLSHKDVTQTLPWRVEGSVIHEFDDKWQLGLQGQANDVENLYHISAGYQFHNERLPAILSNFVITGLFEPQTDALGVAVDSHYGGLKLLTDDLDSNKSKRAEVSLYGRYSW